MMGTAEFKVGLFVLVCLGIVAAMSFQVNNDVTAGRGAHQYDVMLPDASGLVKNSDVKMAGIPVGVIKDIKLQDGEARVVLKIKPDLRVTKQAMVKIKPNGILGDKYLDLDPGPPEAEPLAEGGRIMKYEDKAGFDSVLNQLGKIAQDMSDITDSMKKAISGEGDDTTTIGRIVKNIEGLTGDLREIADNKKDKLEATIDNLHSISKSINEFINDDSDEGFKANWKKMAKSLGRVDDILKNVDEATAKVNEGKGTLGKLINDDTTVEELNHAVAGVNSMLDTASKFQVAIDYHSEFMAGGPFTKTFVGINIQPGPDRYYILQVIDDPKGVFQQTTTQTIVGGVPQPETVTQNNYQNQLKFSAEFAKNFYDLTLRAGVIENTGGFGLDYYLFNHKLMLSAEAFAFGRPEGVDVRVLAKYKFYNIFYAVFGGDDIVNKGNNFDGTAAAGFIGAGLEFTNDDLKLLLTKVPF